MGFTVIKETHLDHGLNEEHIKWLKEQTKDMDGFFVKTFELPESLPPVPCSLYGPVMGDEPIAEGRVYYARRTGREHTSRLIVAPQRATRLLTIICGYYDGATCVLFTAFGGPLAPKEIGDMTLEASDDETKKKSKEFWKTHALVEVGI